MNMEFVKRKTSFFDSLHGIDQQLLFAVLAILSIGLVMIYSASISHADFKYNDNLFYLKRHLIFLLLGIAVAFIFLITPSWVWCKLGTPIFIVSILLLVAVLFAPKINGSRRWISLGFINLQAAEVAKFAVIIFLAGYFQRHQQKLKESWKSVLSPLFVIGLVVLLLFKQPDYGSMVIISTTVFCMLFVVGVPLWQFGIISIFSISGLAYIAVMEPYRIERLKSFLNPWLDPRDTGYQVTNSLMAFGEGEWFGVGLGNSVQKLHYLPEAHTDFIFSIYAEEFGLIGVTFIILLYVILIHRILHVARRAMRRRAWFCTYTCIGIAIILALQSFINIAVTSGLLPTKGITLPFISYGGSSLLVCIGMISLVLRISSEVDVVGKTMKRVSRVKTEN
jgi:cell division protein FtsW